MHPPLFASLILSPALIHLPRPLPRANLLGPFTSLPALAHPQQASSTSQPSRDGLPKKRDELSPDATPLEKMLQNAGPLRDDGSDRFFGFENVRPPAPSLVRS